MMNNDLGLTSFVDDGFQSQGGARLARVPEGFNVYGKHNATNGLVTLSIQHSGTDDADYDNVDVKEFEFFSLIAFQSLQGNFGEQTGVRASVNMSARNLFDVYKVTGQGKNAITESKGLYHGGAKTNEMRLRSQYRVLGVLRTVNGKKADALPELVEYGDDPIPVVFDLTYAKARYLLGAATNRPSATITRIDVRPALGKLIKVSGGMDAELKYETSAGGRVYAPKFAVETPSQETITKFNKYAASVFPVVQDYLTQVRVNDDFLNELYEAGFDGTAGKDLIDQLRKADVTDLDALHHYLETHGGWANLKASLEGSNVRTFGSTEASASTNSSSKPSAQDQFNETNDSVTNEQLLASINGDLPFPEPNEDDKPQF